MLLKSISVCDFGALRRFEMTFRDEFNEIQTSAVDELATALGLIMLDPSLSTYPELRVRESTKIEAVLQTKQTDFSVVLAPGKNDHKLLLSAYGPDGADRTQQYLQTVSSNSKENDRNIFHGDDRNIFFALKHCGGEAQSSSPRNMSGSADIIPCTQAFVSYRRRYVKDFRPVPICKGYFLSIRENGCFCVEDKQHNSCTGSLSESDERLARYICFLHIASFWDGFEQLRNIHYERKPLILLDFLEFLDDSVFVNGKLQQADKFGNQILALTSLSCNKGI